ncbi:MAG: TIGR03621 family F420-dependent LLM class oxidoreductase [Microthrixaceae bacterium]
MTHPRRFRFGAQLREPLHGRSWAETARQVEEWGYSTLFVPDHLQEHHGPIAVMSAVAAATERLRVGSLVFDNDFRHPMLLAKELATIDAMSGGRVELGIGAGWKREDYDQSGIPMDPPGVRVDRLIEAVEVIRRCFTGEPFDFEGEHYTIRGATGHPAPATAGGPPLIVAGGGPRMLRFAGRVASIVGVNPSIHSGVVDTAAARDGLAAAMDAKFGWVREGAGDRFDELELNAWVDVCSVTDDAAGFASAAASAFGLAPEEAAMALESPMVLVGTVDELCERIEMRRDRWGFSYHVIGNGGIEAFAPIAAAMTGR